MLPNLTAPLSLRGSRPSPGLLRAPRGAVVPAVNAACLDACAPGRADSCHAQCGSDLNCWAQCGGSQGVASCVAPCYQSAG